jgi:hypothetical protein
MDGNIYNFKSKEEEYFSYYLDELKLAGYIDEWYYEKDTFNLSESVSLPYLTFSRKKIIEKYEFILHKASITADFTIRWNKKAENIFYLNPVIPIVFKIKDIPFRINSQDVSYVEIKAEYEGNTSSSISFPYKQKWLYSKYGIYIQKIRPFSYTKTKGILFQNTFTPEIVIGKEIYYKNCKGGKTGESKLKYNIKSLKNFITDII